LYTFKDVVKQFSPLLKNTTHIPIKEVEILLLYILKKNIIWLHINYNKECKCKNELKKLVQKRATNYPIEYIIKKASFYGETFNIEPNVLIPRPQTEILVEKAIFILNKIQNPIIVEIGTGSGVVSIMLAILIKNITIIAVDINEDALNIALNNAKKFNVEDKITFIKSDLYTNINTQIFDMCISNPPYICNNYNLPLNVRYEPKNALFGGMVGDELLKTIINNTNKKKIKYLLCEIGYDQKESFKNYFNTYKMKQLKFYKDYDKFDRGFIAEFDHK
jgi:release factor glutamine methyltransferase